MLPNACVLGGEALAADGVARSTIFPLMLRPRGRWLRRWEGNLCGSLGGALMLDASFGFGWPEPEHCRDRSCYAEGLRIDLSLEFKDGLVHFTVVIVLEGLLC